tara:strand:+ start:105 stop:437 length:333 start_codon:yes stop_codon:yes gene_type:complete
MHIVSAVSAPLIEPFYDRGVDHLIGVPLGSVVSAAATRPRILTMSPAGRKGYTDGVRLTLCPTLIERRICTNLVTVPGQTLALAKGVQGDVTQDGLFHESWRWFTVNRHV